MKLLALVGMGIALIPAAFGVFNGASIFGLAIMAVSIPLVIARELLRRD